MFFYEDSKAEMFIERSQNPKEHRHKILELRLEYFQRYGLWKLGLFQDSIFHLKEVIVGKSS